jgi:ABC-2 type transport system ATP-binding protein
MTGLNTPQMTGLNTPQMTGLNTPQMTGLKHAGDLAFPHTLISRYNTTVLVVEHLQKRYDKFIAVQDVSFHVRRGEVYGLLGPNGAGKSSTIRVLSCLAKPDAGVVRIDGMDIVRHQAQVKRTIGIVPQDFALYDDFSALENLKFFGRLYGLGGADLKHRATELLEAVGLLERQFDAVGTFSGGMKRRINIAAGLMHRPKMLYLDEPTVGIDPQSRRKILDLVKTLNAGGLTVLYTTHYMEEAEELCHRIGVIDQGKIIAEGTLSEMRKLAGETAPIRLELRQPLAQQHLEQLRTLADDMIAEDNVVTLFARDPKTALSGILQMLSTFGAHLDHLELDEPDLETVFLKLTGRRLRD